MYLVPNTHDDILDAALELFAVRGSEAVSIRDICERVGIRESSVYYHFPGKRAITVEIYSRFERGCTELMDGLESALERGRPEPRAFLGLCARYFDRCLMDVFSNRVLRLLSIEQHSDELARSLYRRWVFDEPLAWQTRAFAALTGRADAGRLAVSFYAPVFLFAQRWLLCGPLSPGDKAAFRADAYRHVRRFLTELGLGV